MYIAPTENAFLPLLGCAILAGLFVGSLYIWTPKYGRNHPITIKQRFCSVLTVVTISPLILKMFITSEQFKKFSIFELIGIRIPGLFAAATLPLLLTMVLFLGPLFMNDYSDIKYWILNVRFWTSNFTNLVWVRNVVVGPLSEEFTFRACMMPLLMQCFSPFTAVFICSMFFGLAHIHHIVDRYKEGEALKIILLRTIVQFLYTSLFGGYSAYLFIKTGHFISLFVVHAFCNIMSFPDFEKLFSYENPKRTILLCLFVLGVVLWYNLLEVMTNNRLYSNTMFYNG